MIHRLTIGHLDPAAISDRRTVATRPLNAETVQRLLTELGGTDPEGNPTIGGAKVEISDATVTVPWMGGRTNRAAEEFARRLAEETGCIIADVNGRRVIEPAELRGEKAGIVR